MDQSLCGCVDIIVHACAAAYWNEKGSEVKVNIIVMIFKH